LKQLITYFSIISILDLKKIHIFQILPGRKLQSDVCIYACMHMCASVYGCFWVSDSVISVINARLYLKEHFSVSAHVMHHIVSALLILFYSSLKFPGRVIETYLLQFFSFLFWVGDEDKYRNLVSSLEQVKARKLIPPISSLTWQLII
jgi:hypothetical protein